MKALALLMIGLLGVGGPEDYSRLLDARHLDQPTLDAEGYGPKTSLKREDDGLRIVLGVGEPETGWKTPPQLKIGGNFTITVDLVVKGLPKPNQEDGAAIGLAIAFQDANQPDLTLLRLKEPNGQEVYRSVDKGLVDPAQQQMQMQLQMQMQMRMMNQPGAPPPKPPRRTFPASGEAIRLEIRREGNTARLQVEEAGSSRPRYLGQIYIGPNDVSAVKVFASNRNGAEPINILVREVSIRATRLTGLGTSVRTVFDSVAYGEPTAIEGGLLVVGGPSKTPPPSAPNVAVAGPAPTAPQAGPAPAPAAVPAPAAPGAPAMIVLAPGGAGMVAVAAPLPAATSPVLPGVAQANPANPTGAQATPAASTEPKAKIPLDEVESIRFERTPSMTGRFVGQPNLDLTMPHPNAKKDEPKKEEPKKEEPLAKAVVKAEQAVPKAEVKKEAAPAPAEAKKAAEVDVINAPPPGTAAAAAVVPKVEPKKNGIRDLNLSISGLRASPIRQITVNCPTDKGPTSWRLDTSGSQDWPLVVRRSGTQAWADLFLEPPLGDCFQKDFQVSVNYQDGQMANATIKADKHSDPTLAVDPKEPSNPRADAWIHLSGEEKVFGKLESIGEETLRITTPWQDPLDIPLARVVGIHLAPLDPKESVESFARRIKARGSEDLLLARTRDGEVLSIAGILEGSENDRLLFRYQGRTRKLAIDQVEGLVMAQRPEPDQPDVLRSTFSLPGNIVVTGRWKEVEAASWKVETPWGQVLNLPAPDVLGVKFRGGKVTYLSDLTPSKVEESPFFGRKFSWRRDVGLLGEPLKIDDRTFDRGVAVHSRSILTYDLNGRYARFEALVGFDEAAKGKGRVDCRVFADRKEIHANPDFRADGPPVKLNLPIDGADQLKLVVDFGRGQDTGDRVIWANARLYRK